MNYYHSKASYQHVSHTFEFAGSKKDKQLFIKQLAETINFAAVNEPATETLPKGDHYDSREE